MTFRRAFLFAPVLLGVLTATLAAEDVRTGKPLVRNYHHRDFRAEVQNWDVVQGDSGIMYFANNAGVLEFDGRAWRLIELPSRLDVRTLVKDPGTGRIYVGATGDFGYLGPDAVGQLQFHSLLPPEASQDKSFDQIFTPAVTPDGIYFQARNKVCRWSNQQLRCHQSDVALSRIFTVGGRNYVQKKAGLMELIDGSLRQVPGGERFTGAEITVLLPYVSGREERLLVGTRDLTLFVQTAGAGANGTPRGGTFVPFATAATQRREADDELQRGAVLPDGSFVLATRRRGVLILDRDGRLLQQIDQSAGLQENHVHAVWADRDGGLWLALQSGVSRVDVGSPFSVFDTQSGLEREWREIVKHQGTLYVRGYKGLFAADSHPVDAAATGSPAGVAPSPRFTRVREIEAPVWAIASAGASLLASSKDGVYEIHNGRPRRIITYPSMPLSMYRSRSDPGRVYVGLQEGVASLHLTNGVWRDEGRLEGIDESVTSIAEGSSGALWLVSQRQRVIRVEFTDAPATGEREAGSKAPRIRVNKLGRGALAGRVSVREVAGHAMFLTEDGVYEFDDGTEKFVRSPSYAALSDAGRRSFSWIAEDARGDVWVSSRKPGAVDILRRQFDGRHVPDTASLLQVSAWSVYPEPDSSVVWLCAPDYLLRYDLSVRTRAVDFETLIRKVTVNEDTTVFGGAAAALSVFPYRSNSLRFEFAAPRFADSERSEFQSYLDGFDRHWSGWSKEPSRSYTNLPSGTYRFHVRARDDRGVVGRDAVFGFSILRPWYRSWVAYATYGLFVCGALVGLCYVQIRRAQTTLQREREHMELEKLRELDRMKSRFFTDISHEFRTPLTLILGPIGQMLQETSSSDVRHRLQLVRRNAEYLLRLISQLLDLSKVESRTMRLRVVEGDLVPVVKTFVLPFAAVAEQHGIDLHYETNSSSPNGSNTVGREVTLFYDREVLEKIVNNLLANALKFTPRGGTVRVSVRSVTDLAEIVVSDTGIGMPRDQIAHIFERFYQGDGGRSREGIGVGLALVKELVELHGGTIEVESEERKGTTFTVRLPKGRDHLRPDEIVQTPAAAARTDEQIVPTRQPALSLAPLDLDLPRSDGPASETAADDRAVMDERTVLIVEDHADVRMFLRDQLQPYYKVIEAKDGSAGLAAAMSCLPDLVLSDVMMGPVNGYELCKALKTNEKTCHIPVVLLTAKAGRDDKLMGLEIGADCYLVKPFDASELLAQVRNLIDQRRLLRERFSSAVVLKPSEMAVTPMDEAFLTRVLAVVESSLSDPEFDVEHLGREVGLSRSQLHRKLRALTNQPPTLLIRSIRLQRAAELLRQEAGSVAEVAYRVGFSSQAYFAKCFREQFGCAPREYARTPTPSPPPSAAS